MDAYRRPGRPGREDERGPRRRRKRKVHGGEKRREALQDLVVEIVGQLVEVPELDELPADEPQPGERLFLDELQPLIEPEPGRLHRRHALAADLRGPRHEVGMLVLRVRPHEGRRHVQPVGVGVVADEEHLAAPGRQEDELVRHRPVAHGHRHDHQDRPEGERPRSEKPAPSQAAAEPQGQDGEDRRQQDEVVAVERRQPEYRTGRPEQPQHAPARHFTVRARRLSRHVEDEKEEDRQEGGEEGLHDHPLEEQERAVQGDQESGQQPVPVPEQPSPQDVREQDRPRADERLEDQDPADARADEHHQEAEQVGVQRTLDERPLAEPVAGGDLLPPVVVEARVELFRRDQ